MEVIYVPSTSHLRGLNLLNNFYFDKADYYFAYCPSSQLKAPVKFRKIYLHLQVQEFYNITFRLFLRNSQLRFSLSGFHLEREREIEGKRSSLRKAARFSFNLFLWTTSTLSFTCILIRVLQNSFGVHFGF